MKIFGWHTPYIRRERITAELERARKDEHDTVEEEWRERFTAEVNALNDKHQLEISSKDAKISSLQAQLDDSVGTVNFARQMYVKANHMVREAKRISVDIRHAVEQKFEFDAHFFQSFLDIQKSAEDYEKQITDAEEDDIKRLQINKRKS